MIRTKTMRDGARARIIIPVDGESFEQTIIQVDEDRVWVKSGNGNEYPVTLSDRVKMTMTFNPGDTAVIKKFKRGWLVFDIIPAVDDEEPVLSPEEERAETERQIREIEEMWGGY